MQLAQSQFTSISDIFCFHCSCYSLIAEISVDAISGSWLGTVRCITCGEIFYEPIIKSLLDH